MFESLITKVTDWLYDFARRDLLPEAIGLLLIVLLGISLGGIFRRILQRIIRFGERRHAGDYAPWFIKVLQIVVTAIRPISIWIVGQLVIRLYEAAGWPYEIIDFLLPFVVLWFAYLLLKGIIETWFKPEHVPLWRDHILRPTIIVLAFMHTFGILDSILDYRVSFTEDINVSIGAIIGGLLVLYLFILLGNWVKGLLRDVILPRMDIDSLLRLAVTQYLSRVYWLHCWLPVSVSRHLLLWSVVCPSVLGSVSKN